MQKPETKNKKVVLAGGCFDILHYGHIYFLKKAKALGDYLIIALESDKNIKRMKGKKRPIHDQNLRREALESLNFVDRVIILADKMEDGDYNKFVKIISPQVIAIATDDPMIKKKQKQAEEVGAILVKIPKIKTPSTTQIIKLFEID
jgi:FAD synthetase